MFQNNVQNNYVCIYMLCTSIIILVYCLTVSGPWSHVSRYQAEMEGPEDMEEPGQ